MRQVLKFLALLAVLSGCNDFKEAERESFGEDLVRKAIERSFENIKAGKREPGFPERETEVVYYEIPEERPCNRYDLVKITKDTYVWEYHFRCPRSKDGDVYVSVWFQPDSSTEFVAHANDVSFGRPIYIDKELEKRVKHK